MNQLVRLPSNVDTYYSRLRGSMKDKLFFVERLPSDITVVADFGCGSGNLLDFVGFEMPKVRKLLGYDISEEAIRLAQHNQPDVFWTPRLGLFKAKLEALHKAGHKSVLVLSSVVHEVLSQGYSWAGFWAMVRGFGCDYIAIRDMAVSGEAYRTPVDADLMRSLAANDLLANQLLYGVSNPGHFANRAEMLQALLKYHYAAGFEKELEENYFPLSAEEWLNLTTVGSGYTLKHYDHYSLPYHRERWMADLGVNIPDATHIKLILKRA